METCQKFEVIDPLVHNGSLCWSQDDHIAFMTCGQVYIVALDSNGQTPKTFISVGGNWNTQNNSRTCYHLGGDIRSCIFPLPFEKKNKKRTFYYLLFFLHSLGFKIQFNGIDHQAKEQTEKIKTSAQLKTALNNLCQATSRVGSKVAFLSILLLLLLLFYNHCSDMWFVSHYNS